MSSTSFDSLLHDSQVSGYTGDQPTINKTKYIDNINHAIQEKFDKTEGRAVNYSGVGFEKIRFSFMGKKTATEPASTTKIILPEGVTGITAGSKNPTRHDLSNRWMAPRRMHDDSQISKNQSIMQNIDLKSPTTVAIAMAFGRARCLYFLEGVIGNAWIGEDEANIAASALGTDQIISHSDVGLTSAKVRRAKMIMDYFDVPDSERNIYYSAEQLDDMMDDPQIIDRDFNNIGLLRDGKIPDNMWLGFEWVRVSKDCLPVTGTGQGRVRKVVCTWKQAVARGIWTDVQDASVDRIPEWFNDWLIQNDAYMNGSRSHDQGVVVIECKEQITPLLDS